MSFRLSPLIIRHARTIAARGDLAFATLLLDEYGAPLTLRRAVLESADREISRAKTLPFESFRRSSGHRRAVKKAN